MRVHPEVLKAEELPVELSKGKGFWENRYRSIRDLEKHLYLNGTRTIKFFLHLSKEEQRRRFLERIDDPAKNWKIGPADLHERKYWDAYMKAYEACLSATTSGVAPWYIVPADDKENARLIISQIIVDNLKGLNMSFPKLDARRQKELQKMRKQLVPRPKVVLS